MSQRILSYRSEIIQPLLTSLSAGESCSIVGINGIGKTNMLQHLQRADVQAHYLPNQPEPLAFVSFDANMLTSSATWAIFEGLAEALTHLVHTRLPEEMVKAIHETHTQILATPGDYPLAFRLYTRILQRILDHHRLVILFDEFDALFATIPSAVLRNLRGLRDRFKYRLMFLSFSRERLVDLRDTADWDEIEPFVELFTLREIGLHSLSAVDAEQEIVRFAERHKRIIDPIDRSEIIRASGGHAALIRALTQEALLHEGTPSLSTLLQTSPALRLECQKIWEQLSSEEQDDLWRVVAEKPIDRWRLPGLYLKGLIRVGERENPVVFSALLETYIALTYTSSVSLGGEGRVSSQVLQVTPTPAPILVDRPTQRVIYYGRDISDGLSSLQYAMLAYLHSRLGELCAFDEIAGAVYPPGDPSNYREPLATLARRLVQRLQTLVPDEPVLLRIYKGRGYRLGFPREECS